MNVLQEFLVTICGSQIPGVTSRKITDTLLEHASKFIQHQSSIHSLLSCQCTYFARRETFCFHIFCLSHASQSIVQELCARKTSRCRSTLRRVYHPVSFTLKSRFGCLYQHMQITNTDCSLSSHTSAGKPDVGKSIQSNIAKCVASLTKNGSKDDSLHTINSLVAILKSPKSTIDQKSVALLSIGEIGRLMGTSQYNNLFETVLGFMSGSGEELKSGAAVALGALSSGEATVYSAKLLPQIKQQVRFLTTCAMALYKFLYIYILILHAE